MISTWWQRGVNVADSYSALAINGLLVDVVDLGDKVDLLSESFVYPRTQSTLPLELGA